MMASFQKPLVALVEDDPTKRAFERLVIELMGCAVQEFEDGEDFLANASRESACVILNECLPRLSGHATFHRMRRDGWMIPVISESGCLPNHMAQELYGHGQVAHLSCPCTLAQLEDVLRTALRVAGYCLPPEGVAGLDPKLLRWNAGAVLRIGRFISEKRAFADLPILGDALEEAGCTNADILDHCRQPSEHFRGCWVLDQIYGLVPPESRFEVIRCHECKQKLRVPNELGELEVHCPKCKHRFEWSRRVSLLFFGWPSNRY